MKENKYELATSEERTFRKFGCPINSKFVFFTIMLVRVIRDKYCRRSCDTMNFKIKNFKGTHWKGNSSSLNTKWLKKIFKKKSKEK